ncbi:MAG TPA: FliM/FliN family flagellar motor switch protein [Phycisphaerae bacterium]|nr:FliM/FliN family flagellar motor switch protein [Phycisphaerae bacterium]
MFSQNEIDAVLQEAQSAVEDLSRDVAGAVAPRATERGEYQGAVSQPDGTRRRPVTRPGSNASTPSISPRLHRILKLRVPVKVRLAQRSLSVAEILRIAPGTILEFERDVESELDLMVANRAIGRGIAVKVNERFGIRITSIGNVRERIESLGKIAG